MKKAIICIDDEPTILTALKTQLKTRYGNEYIYEFAESGEEGLEIIEEFIEDEVNIVIIVSDWLMPDMRGDELLIKVHEKHPKIVKILLTGQADDHAVTNAHKSAELHRYLQKPWSENELFEAIDSGLQKIN